MQKSPPTIGSTGFFLQFAVPIAADDFSYIVASRDKALQSH
jgi:hypothetical protein